MKIPLCVALLQFCTISGDVLAGLPKLQPSQYVNPILPGFYPDPSICRVGDEYFLVNSTFAYYPGIPVFRSRNLVDWALIGYVIHNPDELNYDSLGVSRGIFAPAIRYHNGLFYVTCTFVDGGGNFVVTAKNPGGPWSPAVWLPEVSGIDPSLFFDEDGTAWLLYNSEAPDHTPLYPGHRTIRMRSFNTHRLCVNNDERILVNGGTNIANKPIWIEGPHLFKVRGVYYLIAAEGGTAEDHSEVVFRSRNIGGPYVPYADNPILTQRDLPPGRAFPVTCAGHADFVEAPGGTWWAVFLGCQPYAGNHYNTGRETFLAPIAWNKDWPIILPHGESVPRLHAVPFAGSTANIAGTPEGRIAYKDNFDSPILDLHWEFLRVPRERWYSLSSNPGSLTIHLQPVTCGENTNPSFVGRRQQHAWSTASAALVFNTGASNEKAGLIVFQNEAHYYYLCISASLGSDVVQLFKPDSLPSNMTLIASEQLVAGERGRMVFLRIQSLGATYAFSYSLDGFAWTTLKDGMDAKFLSTAAAGGFVGCMYGLYATSLGVPSERTVSCDWFSYEGAPTPTVNRESVSVPREQ